MTSVDKDQRFETFLRDHDDGMPVRMHKILDALILVGCRNRDLRDVHMLDHHPEE